MWPYIHLKERRSLTWIERKKARDKAVWGESKWVFFAAQWLCAVALWRQRKLNESQGGILWCWSDSRNQLNLISSSFVTEKNQNLVSVILMIRLEVTCFTLPKLRWWWGARACKRSEQKSFLRHMHLLGAVRQFGLRWWCVLCITCTTFKRFCPTKDS